MISNLHRSRESQPALYIFAFRKRRIINRTCICAWYNFMGPSKTSFLSFYNRNIQTKNINGICEQEGTNFEENVRKAVFNR